MIGLKYVGDVPGVQTRNAEHVETPNGALMELTHVIVDGHDVVLAAYETGWWTQSSNGDYEPAPQPTTRVVTISVDGTLTVTPTRLTCTGLDEIVVRNLAPRVVAVEWGVQNEVGYLPGLANCQSGELVVRARPPRSPFKYNAALRDCENTIRSWFFREPNPGECEALASEAVPPPAPLEVRVPIDATDVRLGHQVVAAIDLGTGIERTILGWCSRASVLDPMLFVTATADGTPVRAFRYNPTTESFVVTSLNGVSCTEPILD